MINLIHSALSKGAKLYASVSGGKDGQAMTMSMHKNGLPITGLVHADLGRIEWDASLPMCEKLAATVNAPLHVIRRSDGLDMIGLWRRRMIQLMGMNKPFWSSSAARYCTSDMKRDPIDKFYRGCGHDLIISCEGIRAAESTSRAKKSPLEIRTRISHSMYKGMTVEQAIAAYTPGKRLAITWYPIFHYSTEDVWMSDGNSSADLATARMIYQSTGVVPAFWNFHEAYVFGNERVSCKFCVLGCMGDLSNAAVKDPQLLQELISMEDESGFTFRQDFSLRQLLA
jgi:3'-phosphoadenosine 5'-phosphosulfate sulfotransferase (PAPS reductase)/FAD synthetase